MSEPTTQYPPVPPDDVQRKLTHASPDSDQSLPHIGLVGDTYTITVSGEETAGRFWRHRHAHPAGRRSATAQARF